MSDESLSAKAIRILADMQKAEGGFISAERARAAQSAINELMDLSLVNHGSLHENEGYTLTRMGRNYKVEKE